MFLIAVIPLRNRQRWAFWALCDPVLLFGAPMLILDGLNVARERLLVTLAPQVGGLVLFLVGLVLAGPAVFGSRPDTHRSPSRAENRETPVVVAPTDRRSRSPASPG